MFYRIFFIFVFVLLLFLRWVIVMDYWYWCYNTVNSKSFCKDWWDCFIFTKSTILYTYLLVSRKHTEEMQKQVITIATSISRFFFFLNGMLRKCAPCQHIAICNWNICVCKKLLIIRESWRCSMLICEFSFPNFYCGGLQIPCSRHEMILYTSSNILDDTNMPIFLIQTSY